MLMKVAIASIVLAASGFAADAQWLATHNDNPFDKTTEQFTFTVGSTGAVLGVRCLSADAGELAIVFGTPERATKDDALALNLLAPKISLIIDDGTRQDLAAEVDTVEIAGVERLRLVARGADVRQSVDVIAGARRRIAVASAIGDKTFHVTKFGASGSRARIAAVLKACGLDQPAPSQ